MKEIYRNLLNTFIHEKSEDIANTKKDIFQGN